MLYWGMNGLMRYTFFLTTGYMHIAIVTCIKNYIGNTTLIRKGKETWWAYSLRY
jgi:hypothetical protein